MLYLDFAASAPIRSRALRILKDSSLSDFANPSSAHKFGKKISKKIENSRDFFLESTKGSKLYQFIFTSSATESNNTIIKGYPLKAGDKVFVCKGDHPSLVVPSSNLSKKDIIIESIPLMPDSTINEEKFLAQLDDSVKLILLTHINNQSGVLNDCFNISKRIKKLFRNIHIHLDAVQSFGKIPIILSEGDIDSVSISSHKIGGPKGIAGLFLKKELKISPLIEGGGQEFSLRSSTTSAPLIESFKEAYEECLENTEQKLGKVSENFLFLKEELRAELPSVFFPFGNNLNTGPFILAVVIPKISSDIILRHLETKDIFISSSSACSSKIKGDNPTLRSLGLGKEFHKNVLRVSFDERVEKKELREFVCEIGRIYKDLSYLI